MAGNAPEGPAHGPSAQCGEVALPRNPSLLHCESSHSGACPAHLPELPHTGGEMMYNISAAWGRWIGSYRGIIYNKSIPKPSQNDAKTIPERCQNDPKTMPKRCPNDAKTLPKPDFFPCFLSEKHTIRARGESNRVPPGSDPPTSHGPNHYANPAPEPRLLSGFLCTGNTGPGRAVRINCRPSRKT